MKKFKVKAVNLYGNISNIEKDFEEWEDIIESESEDELLNMLSNNNQVISIEEIESSYEEQYEKLVNELFSKETFKGVSFNSNMTYEEIHEKFERMWNNELTEDDYVEINFKGEVK